MVGDMRAAIDGGQLKIEYWNLDKLIPYAGNARTHSAGQVAEIAGSIRAFGFSNPILVGSDGDVIAGHGRLAAARQLRMAEVPVVVLHGLSEIQRRSLILADNRIGLNAGWDLKMLTCELKDLSLLGADLKTLGFKKGELAAALRTDVVGLTDENSLPDLAEIPVTSPGDIWLLGPHRIACGDSTDPSIVETLLDGAAPQLMVTDPPYGVQYDPEWRHKLGLNKSAKRGKIKNDERADWSATWALFPGQVAYVWHGGVHGATVAGSLVRAGFTIRAQIIWAKTQLVLSRGDFHYQHEPAYYCVKQHSGWTGDRKQTTLWTIPSGGQDTKTKHSTQKPVECMRRPILNNSSVGESVYEPFLGSGTTLIAAEATGRVCFGIEIDPIFVDVAIRRWQAFSGQRATRQQDGVSFDDVGHRATELASADPETALDPGISK